MCLGGGVGKGLELKTFFPSQLECMRGWIKHVLVCVAANLFLFVVRLRTELKTFFPSQLECMRGWINDVLYKLWEDCDLDRAKFVKLKRKYMVLIMNEEDLNKALYLP